MYKMHLYHTHDSNLLWHLACTSFSNDRVSGGAFGSLGTKSLGGEWCLLALREPGLNDIPKVVFPEICKLQTSFWSVGLFLTLLNLCRKRCIIHYVIGDGRGSIDRRQLQARKHRVQRVVLGCVYIVESVGVMSK